MFVIIGGDHNKSAGKNSKQGKPWLDCFFRPGYLLFVSVNNILFKYKVQDRKDASYI